MYSVKYSLTLSFSSPVKKHFYTLRVLPRCELRCKKEHILVNGEEKTATSSDSFNNRLVSGVINEEHTVFSADVACLVDENREMLRECQDNFDLGYYRYASPLTIASDKIKALASEIKGTSVFSIAEAVVEKISEEMTYLKGVTDSFTEASSALEKGSGVCQDYANIMLSILRAKGIICRYVAGLTEGEGESHAWVEVLSDGIWKGFDPTRKCNTDNSYFPFSYGRDASDSPMNSGVYIGQSLGVMSISSSCVEL